MKHFNEIDTYKDYMDFMALRVTEISPCCKPHPSKPHTFQVPLSNLQEIANLEVAILIFDHIIQWERHVLYSLRTLVLWCSLIVHAHYFGCPNTIFAHL